MVEKEVKLTAGQWLAAMKAAAMKAAGIGAGEKHNPASTTLVQSDLHGYMQGSPTVPGLFADPGVRPEMFTTLVRPRSFFSLCELTPSEYSDELIEVMTGQLESSCTNPDDFCGNPPVAGNLKKCKQKHRWGKWFMKTDIKAIPEIGGLRNRADVPRNIINAGPESHPLIPSLMWALDDTRSVLRSELFRLGVEMGRSFERVGISGSISQANTSTECGWMREYNGLDSQIKTGYMDHDTDTLCPALDSIVYTYGADVGATGSDGRPIQVMLEDLVWSAEQRAVDRQMQGVSSAFVMRREKFRCIVNELSCRYSTDRCSISEDGIRRDYRDVEELRSAMARGQFLRLENGDYPVIFSEGIPQTHLGSNVFESDILFTPVSWQGWPGLRMEYFPMDNQYATEWRSFLGADRIETLNNGLYMVGERNNGFCNEYLFGAMMRLILEWPWLAGRIDNVQCTVLTSHRNAYPDDTFFYADGGITYGH